MSHPLLNVLPYLGIESWVSFEVGYARNSRTSQSCRRRESVVEALRKPHLYPCAPTPIFPLLFIVAPQRGT